MFKKLLVFFILLLTSISLSGCTFKKVSAALQIRSKPVANVFIDGKLLGKTPYQTSDLKGGELSIKLIPESDTSPLVSWEGKVKVNSGVLTLIERDFAADESASSGQILTLEKIKDKKQASLSVVSDPDGALVKVDGESKGFAPLVVDKVNEGDHEIVVSKDGCTEKVVNAKAVLGYKLIVNVKLAQGLAGAGASLVTPTGSPALTPTPTGKAKTTPTKKEETKTSLKPNILIKDTPTGWLRVRISPSTSASEAAKVKPGETYPLLEEKSGWYKIRYEEGKEGWISGVYATPVD